jgi:hypothetical protein
MRDNELAGRARESVFGEWAGRDPVGLIDYLEQRGDSEALAREATRIASSYAREDAASAAAWALSLEDPKMQARVMDEIVEEWLDHDTLEANIFISELEDGPVRDKAVEELVKKVRQSDSSTALTWGLTMNNKRSRQNLLPGVVRTMKAKGQATEARKLIRGSDLPDAEKEKYVELLKDKTT